MLPDILKGPASLGGRILIALIFLMSGVGNKIPNFSQTVEAMTAEGVPMPNIALAGAIVFLIVGSVSIILGYKVEIGAALLAIFLILATYYFHDFWTFPPEQQQGQIIQFMKNLSILGAFCFLAANGAGPWSLDRKLAKPD